MDFKSDLLSFLKERGFLYQCSSYERLDDILSNQKIKAYIGFDCTGYSLHVGSLLQILLLKYLQKYGHTPVVLLGGGTTIVGDPSGKDKSRQILSMEEIHKNTIGIRKTLESFFSFEGKNAAVLLNNADWLCNINYLDFLREFGSSFTINRMMSFDSVKARLEREQPLTFLEFNYLLLQAVDFHHLYNKYGVTLQMGGSDQWGNIINGIELVRRTFNQEVFGLTSILVTRSDGEKMGKSLSGAVWINADMFSTWDFYQYFRNVTDIDVFNYLKLFTEIPITEIDKLSKLQGKDINDAKKILAFEVTKLCHGEKEAFNNQNIAMNTFEKGETDSNLPSFFISENELNTGILLVSYLSKISVTSSNSEGRKLIQNGGVKINGTLCSDINHMINKTSLLNGIIKISIGKKKHVLLKAL